jgi:DNA-directed RNA polymerase specialized sigma24 family protein
LPQDYANLLEEKYLDGLSVRQIAQRRGVGEKSVESALSRAREAFREKYERLQIQQER